MGGSDEREPTRAILLRLGGTIAQPAKAMKADGASKGVACLALVELCGWPAGRITAAPTNRA
jgi:hypothetical protein